MFLNKKIACSSIAEVVVALAVLSICFTIASLIFIRSTNSASKFMDIKKQTIIQNTIMENLVNDTKLDLESISEDIKIEHEDDEWNDSLEILNFYSFDQRLIWSAHQQK